MEKELQKVENNSIIEYTNDNIEIKNLIYTIRGKQVMLDSDLAMLFNTETRAINQAVKRNIGRFPDEFGFQLLDEEFENLRSQFVILNLKVNNGRVTRKYNPYVFTEEGIIMLSSLLRSEIAIKVSIKIVETFVEMRRFLNNNGHIFQEINNIKGKLLEHDKKFDEIFNELQHEENIKQKIFFEGQIWDSNR